MPKDTKGQMLLQLDLTSASLSAAVEVEAPSCLAISSAVRLLGRERCRCLFGSRLTAVGNLQHMKHHRLASLQRNHDY